VKEEVQPTAPNAHDQCHISMTNAIVHLWLAIQYLEPAGEHNASADIRSIMEGLGQKHGLPVIEADAICAGLGVHMTKASAIHPFVEPCRGSAVNHQAERR
jgi:hypothetical protein